MSNVLKLITAEAEKLNEENQLILLAHIHDVYQEQCQELQRNSMLKQGKKLANKGIFKIIDGG